MHTIQSQVFAICQNCREGFFGPSKLHLKFEIEYNRTDCVSRRIIITIAKLIVGEVVSLRTAEFPRKVVDRATTNPHELADLSQIHRMWIMQRGNTRINVGRDTFDLVRFHCSHPHTNIYMWKARDSQNKWKKTRDKISHEGSKLFIVQIAESNGRN